VKTSLGSGFLVADEDSEQFFLTEERFSSWLIGFLTGFLIRSGMTRGGGVMFWIPDQVRNDEWDKAGFGTMFGNRNDHWAGFGIRSGLTGCTVLRQ
jgi:hypothetical protein